MKAEYKGGKKVGVLRNVRSSRPNEYLMRKGQEEYLKGNNEGDLKRNFFGGKRGIYISLVDPCISFFPSLSSL